MDNPGRLADLIVSNLKLDVTERQSILEALPVEDRLIKLLTYLNRELELLKLGNKIQSEVKNKIEENQKEYFLREQLKAIQKELGDKDERTAEIDELKKKIVEAGMPKEARETAEKELDRLAKMPPAGRGIHGFAHLPRLAGRASLEHRHGRHDRRDQGQGNSRRRPLRPRST